MDYQRRAINIVKRIDPYLYAREISKNLYQLTSLDLKPNEGSEDFNRQLLAHRPPHLLIQSLEANFIHYGNFYEPIKLTQGVLQEIINCYVNYSPDYYITNLNSGSNKGLLNFFLALANEQFLWQTRFSWETFGRSLNLFLTNSDMKNIDQSFRMRYQLSIEDWFVLSLLLYTWTCDINRSEFGEEVLKKSKIMNLPKNAIDPYLILSARSPEQYKEEYYERIRKSKIPEVEDFFLPPLFYKYPLVKFASNYLCVNYQLLIYQVTERLYSLCQEAVPDKFPTALGKPFESYVFSILSELNPLNSLKEHEIVKSFKINGQVCDSLYELEDALLLVECKAVKCTAIRKSLDAMRTNNSMRKIGEAINQLISTGKSVKRSTSKPIYGLVVTYGEFYFPNNNIFFENLILPNISIDYWKDKDVFDDRPVIISVSELEHLLEIAIANDKSIIDLLIEKKEIENDNQKRMTYEKKVKLNATTTELLCFMSKKFPEVNFKDHEYS